ncbi:stage II sporulation protein R [Paenibacillus sp. 598K]|uniref:stage II sporulation protein R n=1 Tax=Paenibacillus sp. 598K TaxID=1117987 RepID=UPI000FF92C8B|nr:stage II sporulation protein R [Paenibacillus sp. 598K]GBF74578.1 stage II sporulation protein R [Paenibacillus sp. 598K]
MVIRNHTRYSYRASYGYLFVILMVLIMSWEGQRMDAAVVQGTIPEESIRLRILANSDAPQDQAIKRHVRGAIVAEMASWARGPQTIDDARVAIRANLAKLESTVAEQLRSRGFAYDFKVELATVPFPTKMYGSQVYPAGDYEALRVTLGAGDGQNWWCVLFPPLCFVDGISGEAAAAEPAMSDSTVADTASAADVQAEGSGEAPEVKFFLWELIESIVDFFRGLFS